MAVGLVFMLINSQTFHEKKNCMWSGSESDVCWHIEMECSVWNVEALLCKV